MKEMDRETLERLPGRFGEGAVCGGTIEEARLRAVPETDRCGGCVLGH